MHLRKKGTVLISTVIILSLMSLLGCFMFKMMRNNLEIGSVYNFDKDRYDLDVKEEMILNRFMIEINTIIKKEKEESLSNENLFSEDFKKDIEGNLLEYYKIDDKLFLRTHKDNEIIRMREINYFFKNDKLVFVPTYKFENKNE